MITEFLEALELNPVAYRALVVLIMTVIVNITGYLENRARSAGTPYEKRKIAETLMVYTPLIVVLAELLPMEQAMAGALVIDVLRRTISHLKGEPPQEG